MKPKYIKTIWIGASSILIILMVTLLSTSPSFAGTKSPFLGSWYGTDLDGSDIRLAIAGNPDGPFHITSTDSYISFCNGEAGIVKGTGALNPENSNVIEANLVVICFTTGNTLDFGTSFVYDPATGTLDGMGVTWHRANDSAPSSPFIGNWYGVDLDGSDIRIVIAGNPDGPFHITSTDSYISFCHGEAGIIHGTGALNAENNNILEANMMLICFTTGDTLEIVDSFVYDPATDTFSGMGVTWYRAGSRNAGAGSPFLGSWYGTDLDGSDIRLAIAGNPDGPFHITSTDSYISFCNGEAGIVKGTGALNPENSNVIEANLVVICFTTGNTLDFGTSFVYDPATDTLSGMGVVWY